MQSLFESATQWLRLHPELWRLLTRFHVWIYRSSGGRLGSAPFGLATLLLMHRGRKSGREFVTPLFYVTEGEGWAVAASAAGSDKDPEWWRNLQAAGGGGRVQVGPRLVEVQASVVEEARREELWSRLVRMYRGYEAYQARTTRKIPVVLLRPVEGG